MGHLFSNLMRKLARRNQALVAVGLRVEPGVEKLLVSLMKAQDKGYARIVAVADGLKGPCSFKILCSTNPARTLSEMLSREEVDAVVRGSLSAKNFLEEFKRTFNIRSGLRVALLRSATKTEFLLAPIGVDDGETLQGKLKLLEAGVRLHRFFGVEPKVAVLSGGRKEDSGRSKAVDRRLAEAEFLTARAKELAIAEKIEHYGILLEEALRDGCTMLLAPNGMTGNLIFRTLVFLGRGRAIGAPYLELNQVVVDVSRSMESYEEAVTLASALVETKAYKHS